MYVEPKRIVEVRDFLKRDENAPFDYLSDLTCVHYPDRGAVSFEIVYNLFSISTNERVRLKAKTSEDAGIDSVTGVWPSANWLEREVYDLFEFDLRTIPICDDCSCRQTGKAIRCARIFRSSLSRTRGRSDICRR